MTAFLCAVAVARRASASPEDIFGFGVRSTAMGATGVASSSDYEAAYTNPALLSRLRHTRLALGLSGATFHTEASGVDLPGRVSAEAARGVIIGAEVPLPFGGPLRDRVGAALAVYTPTNLTVRGRTLYPDTPQFPLYPDRAQSVAVRIGFGADVGYGIRFGAGFAALAEFRGAVTVAQAKDGQACTIEEQDQVATYAPIVGATYDLPIREKIRLGVTFRATLDARFGATIDATKLSTINIPVFNIAGLAQYDPAQVAIEAAHEKGGHVVALGVTYKRWSDYPGALEATILCPPDEPDCGAQRPPSIAFSDTLAVHLGAEQAIVLARDVVTYVRGGAFVEDDPLPSRLPATEAFDLNTRRSVELPTRYFSAARVAFTFGGGVAFEKPLPMDVSFFGQYHVLLPTEIESVSNTGAVLSSARVSGHMLAGGTVARIRF